MKLSVFHLSRRSIALRHPFVTALRRVETVDFVRVILHTSSGRKGIGEAPPTPAITGETMESIEADLQRLGAQMMGLSPHEAQALLMHDTQIKSSAKAALDIALCSLIDPCPISSNVPLRSLITISLASPEAMRREAGEAMRRGCRHLKIKVGGRDGQDALRIETICRAFPEATVIIDANQAWTRDEAEHLMLTCKAPNIALIEQPLVRDDLEGMRRITRQSPIPILADESAFSFEEVVHVIETGAAHMINVKLMKCGGVRAAEEILSWCAAHGVGCMMGSMLEGPRSIAAAIRLSRCFADTVRFVDLDSPLLYADGRIAALMGYQGDVIVPYM
ncbi:MAG: dipeptide epimerase [Campylobacterales bacterium]|nr:dipeptide epimerase [Campylobacterales bacterium]